MLDRRPILHYQGTPNNAEGLLDGRDVRAVPGIEEPPDRVFLQAQPHGKGDVGHALFPQRGVEGQLGRDNGHH